MLAPVQSSEPAWEKSRTGQRSYIRPVTLRMCVSECVIVLEKRLWQPYTQQPYPLACSDWQAGHVGRESSSWVCV